MSSEVRIVWYRDDTRKPPVVESWLAALKRDNRRAWAKCAQKIVMLGDVGHKLHRPHADYLRDGIRELRARCGNVHYRILYFIHGRQDLVLCHGLTKEDEVPDADIERAIRRMQDYLKDPEAHR